MRIARFVSVTFVVLSAASLVACGGGGGGSGAGASGVVAGQVVLRDGTTQNLGGVEITLAGLGRTVVSRADGSFSFGAVPTGNLAIAIHDPLAPLAGSVVAPTRDGDDDATGDDDDNRGSGSDDGDDNDDDDGSDRDDDDGDDHDVGDDDFDVSSVDDSDDVTVKIGVRDGKVESLDVSHRRDGRVEARVRLARTDVSDDADAQGSAKLEARTDRQKLEVEADHLDAGRSLEAFVILGGVEVSIGARAVGASGEANWEIATNDGGVLPHAAATVADLAGAIVEVRDAVTGLVILRGTLPEVSSTPATGGGGTDSGDRARGRASLVRTAGGAGAGYVEVRRRVDGGLRGKFKVEVEDLASGLALEVWMEDGAGSGSFARIGAFTIGSFGEAELELESQDGDTLPFGVLDVASLVGRGIEVRRVSDGAAILRGTVPALVTEQ